MVSSHAECQAPPRRIEQQYAKGSCQLYWTDLQVNAKGSWADG